MALIEIFLKTIDTIISLSTFKKKRHEQFFNDIIVPIYQDFSPVAQNYFEIFRAIAKVKQDNLDKVRENFIQMREQYLLTRLKVREVAGVITTEVDDPDVKAFAKGLVTFFESFRTQGISKSQDIDNQFSSIETIQIDINELKAAAAESVKKMEISWKEVNQSYAKVKLKGHSNVLKSK